MQKIAFAKPAQAALPTGQEIQQALEAQSAPALKKLIQVGVAALGLDASWAAPKTNDKDELISHISEMCNEHGGLINSVKPLQISKRASKVASSYEKDLDESKPILVSGVKGMKSTPFTKKFKDWAAYEKWSDSEDAGNYSIEQVRNASASDTVAASITTGSFSFTAKTAGSLFNVEFHPEGSASLTVREGDKSADFELDVRSATQFKEWIEHQGK